MLKTFRDPTTGRILTQTGEHIASLEDYKRRVASGEVSGTPEDISKMPSITRDRGDVLVKRDTGLAGLTAQTGFLDTVKEVIRRKQGQSQDLTAAKSYWRTLVRDTSPFGGARDPRSDVPGTFKDEEFRQMSPTDQASIRASRTATAQAHLQGIQEEEVYRGTRVEDTINAITNMMAERDKLAQSELDKSEQLLDIAKKRLELGLEPTAEDLGLDASKGIGTRIGGSLSWRHNNPGNIKMGAFAKQYGAIIGQKATDGGSFAVFPDMETGWQAMRDLLATSGYKNLTVEQAMRRWSNKGYGASITGIGENTKIEHILPHPELLQQLVESMANKGEGGVREGTILSSTQDEGIELSDAKKASLMADSGLVNEDVAQFSADDWILLQQSIQEADFQDAFDYVNGNPKLGIPALTKTLSDQGESLRNLGSLIEAKLVQKYPSLNSVQISSIMKQSKFVESGGFLPEWTYKP